MKLSDSDKLLQPRNKDGSRNERFFKLYGDDIKRRNEIKKRQEMGAKEEWRYADIARQKRMENRSMTFSFNIPQEQFDMIFGKKK